MHSTNVTPLIGTLIPTGNRQYCLIDVPFLVNTHRTSQKVEIVNDERE